MFFCKSGGLTQLWCYLAICDKITVVTKSFWGDIIIIKYGIPFVKRLLNFLVMLHLNMLVLRQTIKVVSKGVRHPSWDFQMFRKLNSLPIVKFI